MGAVKARGVEEAMVGEALVEAARAAVVWVMAARGELVMAGGREVVAKGEVVMAAEMAAVETAAETVRLRVAAREGVEMVVAKVRKVEGMEAAEMVGGMAMLEEAKVQPSEHWWVPRSERL